MSVKLSASKAVGLFLKQKGKCQYCNIEFTLDNLPTADHIIPKNNIDSTNNIKNICLCCQECNLLKWEKSVDEFLDQKEFIKELFKYWF